MVFTGNLHDCVHVGRIPLQMHHHDQLGLRSNFTLDVFGIDVEGFVDLRKHRQRAGQHNGIETGVPGPGR